MKAAIATRAIGIDLKRHAAHRKQCRSSCRSQVYARHCLADGAAASPLAMCHSLTMRSSRTQKTSSLRHRHHRRHHRLQHHRHHHRHRPALSTAINALPASLVASASCPSIRTSAQHTRQRPSFSEDATIIYALISCVRVTASARQTRSSTRARAVGMCTGASLVHRIIHGGGTRRVLK